MRTEKSYSQLLYMQGSFANIELLKLHKGQKSAHLSEVRISDLLRAGQAAEPIDDEVSTLFLSPSLHSNFLRDYLSKIT